VETVGTFRQQALKSSLGEAEWLRFFALMGSVIALKEGTPMVPNTPTTEEELFAELYQLAIELDVENRLRAYGHALRVLEQPDLEKAAYFLLQIDPAEEVVNVKGFTRQQIAQASDEYLAVEKAISKDHDTDAVLVSVDSVASLRRAYPNYFADTHVFLELVGEALRYYEEEYLPAELGSW
jgi:hypothetical protein